MISFLDCPHNNVQQYTEVCLDCGYNIYTTNEEYLNNLKQKLHGKQQSQMINQIKNIETQLGISQKENEIDPRF